MTFTPFAYQVEGAEFLASRRRGLLLDEPGVGKTAQALLAANNLEAESMDVICPASVTRQWRHAHGEVSNDISRDFASFSYEHARDKGISTHPMVLAIDEIHYCSNINSGRTRRILGSERYGSDGLIHQADYVWGLTGTIYTRDPSVLYPILYAVVPGALYSEKTRETLTEWQFIRKFCKYWDTGNGIKITGGANLDELRDRIAPYMLQRTKSEVRENWTAPVIAELWLDPKDAGNRLKTAELEPEARAVEEAFNKGGFDALAELADTDRTGISRYRRYIGILKILPVMKWLLDQFDGGLQKIVLVAVHREVIEGFQEQLERAKIPCSIYYGGLTIKQKEAAIKNFTASKDKAVFVGQIDAMGTGVDGLQLATGRMLFVEWSWLGHVNKQTLDRLDRIGQTEPVLGEFAAFEGSLDGAIMSVAARRAREGEKLFN